MRDETGCYIWFILFALGIGAYIIDAYSGEIIWFLLWAIPVVVGITSFIFLIDYIHTLFLVNFSGKTKNILQFDIDVENIKAEIDSVKNLTMNHYRGKEYYSLIEKSNIFKI